MKVSVLGPFSQQFISILNQIKFDGFVEFCKILPLSIAFHDSHRCMDINRKHLGGFHGNGSPIAPWIPQKLSKEYMETVEYIESVEKFMPLNFPQNVHCFFLSPWKWSSNTPWNQTVESTEFHGNLRDGSGSANACIIRCILSDRV